MTSLLGGRTGAAMILVLGAGLFGCGGGDAGTDSGVPASDAPMMAMQDAPMMAMQDAPMMAMQDAPMMATEDAPAMMMADAPAMAATWTDVHDQMTMSCTPCHSSGMSGGHRMAQANAAMAYADSQLDAVACAGVTKGACAAMRVRAGTMPPGGIPDLAARAAFADLLDSWVAGGQVGP